MQCTPLTQPPPLASPTPPEPAGRLLIIDDEPANRAVLRAPLEACGYQVDEAGSGPEAIQLIAQEPPDAILLDVMMPGMDGYQLCRRLKDTHATAAVPVLLVTALAERKERLRGIQSGANDFLCKPVDLQDLLLRVGNAVHAKSLHDQLQAEREKAEQLLNRLLPPPIAERMKQGEHNIADQHPDATVMWADLAGLKAPATAALPEQLVWLLNELFSEFDLLVEQRQLEKIKTSGDAYLVAGGVCLPRADHAEAIADLALDFHAAVERFHDQYSSPVRLRIGIACGPVLAGVIGRKQFTYDLWGETVEVALRLKSLAHDGEIAVSEAVYERLKETYEFQPARASFHNGHGQLKAYTMVPVRQEA